MSETEKRCSKCCDIAVIMQGHQWLCEKHYRFLQKDMLCPSCKRKMNWRQRDGKATVITLQHNRDGTVQYLCLSCNSRHASREGDSFYNENPNTEKRCPKCMIIKPLNCFALDKSKKWKDRKTTCRECSKKAHDTWLKNNKEKQNEWRRKYYHKRKNEGNPIPR